MSRRVALLLLALSVFTLPSGAFCLVIKMGTLAPRGSPWDEALRELAARWQTISDGEVELKIYPDGIAGDEESLIRKMRLGQLQGAALTQLGLAAIVRDILALSAPFLVRSDAEFAFLLSSLSESYNDRYREKGFIVLSWGEAGWVHFFSDRSIAAPADLKASKLAVPAGDDEMLHIWRTLGFTAFALSIPEYAMGLQSGMVDAFYAPPSLVAAIGWYDHIRYMNALPVAPAMGAIVLAESAWNALPETCRDDLAEAARSAGNAISIASRNLNSASIEVMARNGLIVVDPDTTASRRWRDLGAEGAGLAVGRLVHAAALREVETLLAQFRAAPPEN